MVTASMLAARREIASFAPSSVPLMSRPSFATEVVTTLFFAVALACIDGGVIGVYTKQGYSGIAAAAVLNLAVAVAGAAPDLANIVSFVWAQFAVGRDKIKVINALQLAVIVLVASVPFVPREPWGGWVLVGVVVLARVCWSGIVTLRPIIWRANYPNANRAAIVGRFTTLQQVTVAVVSLGLGAALDISAWADDVIMPLCAAVGLVAFFATRRQRLRQGPAMRRQEAGDGLGRPWQGPSIVWRTLRRDPRWMQFMLCMFVLGLGNLMLTPSLVIVLKEEFGFGYLKSILVITGLPYMLMPLAVPVWARLLDRAHVVHFRSIHGWTFVVAAILMLAAVLVHSPALIFAGSVVQGIAYGGGNLAWNLGHVDFAPPRETSQYMATHVTLNGVRGLAAPFISVFMYNAAKAAGYGPDMAGAWVLGLCLFLCILGSAGFASLRVQMGRAMMSRRHPPGR